LEHSVKERRKGPDFWVISARVIAILSWCVFIIALVLSHFAAPEQTYGIVRYHNIPVRDFWNKPLTDYLYLLLWFSAIMSFICLVINQFRSRRATDSTYFNAILLLFVCLAWLTYIYRDNLG
jgi:magnesium-transporting ATPase (P-type)